MRIHRSLHHLMKVFELHYRNQLLALCFEAVVFGKLKKTEISDKKRLPVT